MAPHTDYKNPQEFAQELKNPLTALAMAEKAKDLGRVLEKGMNIHLMGAQGRITISHSPEALKAAFAARETMRQLSGVEVAKDTPIAQRVYDGRASELPATVRGA